MDRTFGGGASASGYGGNTCNWLRVSMGVGGDVYNDIETAREWSAITPYSAMTFVVLGNFRHEMDKRDCGAAAPERNATRGRQRPEDQIWQ